MSKPFVLIVEDDAQLGQIFARTLRDQFETEIASDGNFAVQRLAQVVPDLILLDLNLPGVSGKDILYNIRREERLKDVHVILCTADALQADLLQEDADIMLLKPISPSQLRMIAARFVSRD